MFTEGLPVDHRLDCLLKHNHLAAGVNDGWVVLINEKMLKPESISLIIDHVLDLFLDLGLFKVAQFGFRRSDLLGSGFKALNAFEAELPVLDIPQAVDHECVGCYQTLLVVDLDSLKVDHEQGLITTNTLMINCLGNIEHWQLIMSVLVVIRPCSWSILTPSRLGRK